MLRGGVRSWNRKLHKVAALAAAVFVAIAGGSESANAQSFEVVHPFVGGRSPALPAAALIEAADGKLYGTTYSGGANGDGTIFRISLAGVVETVHSFQRNVDGGLPLAPLLQSGDGRLYGTISQASTQVSNNPGDATSFRLLPDGTIANVTSSGYWILPTGFPLSTTWVQASDGALYLPFSWAHFGGGILKVDPNGSGGTPTNLLPVDDPEVVGPLVQGTDLALYGTTSGGGAFASGTIYRMTLDGTFAIVHEFTGGSGGAKPRSLMKAVDGNLYGTTQAGGAFDGGTIFRLATDGTFSVLHAFAGGSDGNGPISALVQSRDGAFFGTTPAGGTFDQGVIFKMTEDGTVTVLHHFTGGNSDGALPLAPLLVASDGNLYGTTAFGGTGAGTVFRLTPSGAFSLLAALGASGDGASPRASLLRLNDGSWYGTTTRGGVLDNGTIFRIGADRSYAIVHDFLGDGVDGSRPVSGLIQAADGDLYGTTYGTFETEFYGTYGTVYRMSPGGVVTLLHSFLGGSDGLGPAAALVQAADQTFLGSTVAGGNRGLGTLFRITSAGDLTVLHNFGGGPNDGAQPRAALVGGASGNFYGTTVKGGQFDCGTIFVLSPDSKVTLLYSFRCGTDGSSPNGLVRAADGSLYGTTAANGANNSGTMFRLTGSGSFTTLHAFGAAEGGAALAALMLAADGNLYGTTGGGGTGGGAVFRSTLAGDVTVIAALSLADGAKSAAALVQAPDGGVYGTSSLGGTCNQGVVFRITLNVSPIAPASVVRAPSGASGVRLTWTSVATASSYTVRRANGPGAGTALVSGLQGTSFVDTTAVRGQTYYYVVTAVNATGESLPSYQVSIRVGQAIDGDFNADQRAEISLFRPLTGAWYVRGVTVNPGTWGGGGDIPLSGDFDGDGKADVGVFRPSTGTWHLVRSANTSSVAIAWGAAGDIPVPADYDGDGLTDIAVFRPSTGIWYIVYSRTQTGVYFAYGAAGDIPVPADYDGDGKADLAVFRPSEGAWFITSSSANFTTSTRRDWGATGDVPVPADYDGDGRADVAFFRPSSGLWSISRSGSAAPMNLAWGGAGDVPVPADYDGDGQIDIAVFRPATGTWYTIASSTFVGTSITWGGGGDVPILGRP